MSPARARARGKPKAPRTILAEVDVTADMALPQNAGVRVEAADRRRHVERARRLDAFDALRAGMAPGAYDAIRELERLLAIGRGEGDGGRSLERVDCAAGRDRAAILLQANKEAERMLAAVGDRDRWLLLELINPSVETRLRGFTDWRGIVRHITGETHPHGQGAAVRAAAANLATSARGKGGRGAAAG